MIEFIHKYPVFIKVMLSFVVIAFIGTGGWLIGKEEMGDYAAKVEGKKISMVEYRDAESRMEEFYRKIYQGNMPEGMLKKMNIGQKALDALIDKKILLMEADKQGISVTDDEVRDAIKDNKSFQDKDGNFDNKFYIDILKANGLNTATYESSLREELAVDKLKKVVKDAAYVNESELRDTYKKQNPGKPFDEAEFQKQKDNLYRMQNMMAQDKVMSAYMEGLRKAYDIKINPAAVQQQS